MQIKIQQFEGPLDLLLQLIEERNLDVTTVALAEVTEQFLAYIRALEQKNPINLADFLVIAAKLLVIKSKSLLPDLDLGIEEEEAAFDLTARLLQYKKFKEAAKYLKRLDGQRHQSWPREPDFKSLITFLPDPDISISSLAAILKKLSIDLKDVIKIPKEMMKEVISISEKIANIQKLISEKLETSLSALIENSKSKTEIIVTFLALLELVKQRVLVVEQNEMFGDVIIKKVQDGQA